MPSTPDNGETVTIFSIKYRWSARACCVAREACLYPCAWACEPVEVERFVSLAAMFHSWESFSLRLHTARLRVTKRAAHANGHEIRCAILRSMTTFYFFRWRTIYLFPWVLMDHMMMKSIYPLYYYYCCKLFCIF